MEDQTKYRRDGGETHTMNSASSTLRLRTAEETEDAPGGETDEAEARMRAALGLFGRNTTGHHAPQDNHHAHADRRPAAATTGARRHRFVQDGEVPVSVVRGPRREHAPHVTAGRATPAESDRLAEDVAHERAAREQAERRLAEAQNLIRSLQTRVGHAELERDQAVAELRALQARASAEDLRARNRPSSESVTAPAAATDSVRRQSAERAADEEQARDIRTRGRRRSRPEVEAQLELAEPEPVKWWL